MSFFKVTTPNSAPIQGGAVVQSAAQATVTSQDAQLAAATINLFAGLLPFSWRDIGLPYVDMKVVLRQDLAIHRFANLDGADVEPTGRSPIEISARIPFLNHISPAAGENWQVGQLYSDQFDLFWKAVVDRSPAYLQHPHFGAVYCVVSHCEVDWKATTRDGVYVNVVWIETFEPGGGVSPNVAGSGQVSLATQAGIDLDTLLVTVPNILGQVPTFGTSIPSFADFARSLQSVGDQISLLQYQVAGKLDDVLNRVQTTLNSFSGPTNSPLAAAASVECWQTRDACDRYINAIKTLQRQLLSTGKQVGLYYPAANTSLVLCAQSIPCPVGDLLNLNPALAQQFVVPQGTPVQYYLPNQS